jgi:hypothetical protein
MNWYRGNLLVGHSAFQFILFSEQESSLQDSIILQYENKGVAEYVSFGSGSLVGVLMLDLQGGRVWEQPPFRIIEIDSENLGFFQSLKTDI